MSARGGDPVSDLLQGVRVTGAVLLHDTYPGSWAVRVPSSEGLARLVRSRDADRVVAFHYVEAGWLDVVVPGELPCRAGPGDLIVNAGGLPHLLRRGDAALPRPLAAAMSGVPVATGGGDASDTTVLCGVFVLQHLERSPRLAVLPGVIHLTAGSGEMLEPLTDALRQELRRRAPGSTFVISRLLELLFAEALRHAHDRDAGPWGGPGRLAALTDPVVAAAVDAVRSDPGAPWTVGALAAVAGISPSRLTARFRTTMRQSPMGYTTGCRMAVAADLLDGTDLTVRQVATRVGYSGNPAFSRAFRRHHGIAPVAWRHRDPPRTG